MQRRSFLKKSCDLCMATAFIGAIHAIEGCAPALYNTFIVDNKVRVPMSEFGEKSVKIIRVKNQLYDLAMIKDPNGQVRVYQMRCTHAENEINFTGIGFTCNLHGSKFNLAGEPIKGPAEKMLTRFKTTIEDDFIIIYFS